MRHARNYGGRVALWATLRGTDGQERTPRKNTDKTGQTSTNRPCIWNIAAQIIEQQGDYILAPGGNQGNLHKKVVAFFEQAILNNWEGIDYSITVKQGFEHWYYQLIITKS